MNTDSAAT